MKTILDWIAKNPSAFASLTAATIAASVALLVFAITQFLTEKRQRTQFLTPKLEELYLLLNKVSANNVKYFKLIYLALDGSADSLEKLITADELEIYGHSTAKLIIMYIRLYFPRLSTIHGHLLAAQEDLNELIFELHSDDRPEKSDIVSAYGRVIHLLRLTENEIIVNRDHLLRDHSFTKSYKNSSQSEIDADNPPPDGPVIRYAKRPASTE